jgi:SPP1 family predicted phage head-tail adaptor
MTTRSQWDFPDASMPRAGKLRHKVSIQTATKTTDQFGATVTTWTTAVKVMAAIGPITNTTVALSFGQEAVGMVQVVCQYRSSLTIGNRIQFTRKGVNRTFNIVGVHDQEFRQRMCVVFCKELVPSA